MRRRDGGSRGVVEPPARLRAFDPADWSVNAAEYDPARYPKAGAGGVDLSPAGWAQTVAWERWAEARREWLGDHGWPGGLSMLDLLRADITANRVHGDVTRTERAGDLRRPGSRGDRSWR